uniref:Ovule protein n=1 Tax=Steinernema glaseri TaxID=37863 RepID=A0A1I8A5J2_9BILA
MIFSFSCTEDFVAHYFHSLCFTSSSLPIRWSAVENSSFLRWLSNNDASTLQNAIALGLDLLNTVKRLEYSTSLWGQYNPRMPNI